MKKRQVCIVGTIVTKKITFAIGAGPAGIICAKYMSKLEHVGVKVFEQADGFGGTWKVDSNFDHFTPQVYMPASYDALKTNTSRRMTRFYHMEMPSKFPQEQIPHAQVLEYLHMYVKKYKIEPLIQFKSRVTRIEPLDKKWQVQVQHPFDKMDPTNAQHVQTYEFDHVCICTGPYWDPFFPALPGLSEFRGQTVHSLTFRNEAHYDGKKVVVVGLGSSGVDIANLIEKRGKAKLLVRSTRNLARYNPDEVNHSKPRVKRTPSPVKGRSKSPDKSLTSSLPDIYFRIMWKPNVTRIEGAHTVVFADGTKLSHVDCIIFCTGFNFSFPFLSPKVKIHTEKDPQRIDLFMHLIHPEHPSLSFVGVCAVAGSIFNVIEAQAIWLALLVSKKAKLPEKKHMVDKIDQFVTMIQKYKPAKPMVVHPKQYIMQILKYITSHVRKSDLMDVLKCIVAEMECRTNFQ